MSTRMWFPTRSTDRQAGRIVGGRDPRAGFTLVELVIVMIVFAIVTAGALSFMGAQGVAYNRGTDRLTAMRNLSYALASLETDLTTAGTNVAPGQPTLVYVDDNLIAFSADYATRVADDVSAVYFDPSAPLGSVSAPTSPVAIPHTGFSWPDTTYQVSGINSPAELIVFWFEQDTSTTDRSDDWMLLRQVNRQAPELVARALLQVDDEPFFRFLKRSIDPSGIADMTTLPDTMLPLRHDVKVHGSVADTGRSAVIDSLKAVQIMVGSYNRHSQEGGDDVATLSRLVDLPNAGFGQLLTCGDEPILGTTLGVAITVGGTGEPAVKLSWSASVDESSGEGDVIRYVLWRRTPGDPWGDPFLSIPAGAATYSYVDATVASGQQYEYALAAQDCTPSLSGRTASGWITVP
jgi:prepilin-type N-terminal cleavage/methylation domain-containing protein